MIITKAKAVQICKAVDDGADMADIASKYRITIERVEALTGATRKENLSAVEEAATDPASPSAAEDFEE